MRAPSTPTDTVVRYIAIFTDKLPKDWTAEMFRWKPWVNCKPNDPLLPGDPEQRPCTVNYTEYNLYPK